MKLTLKKAILPLIIAILSCSFSAQAQLNDGQSGYNAYSLKTTLNSYFAPLKTRHIIHAVVTDKMMNMIDMAADAYHKNPTDANYEMARDNFKKLVAALEENSEPSPKLYIRSQQMVISEFDSQLTMGSLEKALGAICPAHPYCH